MSSLRGRCRRSKKASTNPYAGRGLDKFALVSAELEAKREKLAEELDTPLSMVKFAIGSHNKWIPVILSRSTRRANNASKKKSAGLFPEDKSTHKDDMHNEDKTHAAGLSDEDRAGLGSEDILMNKDQSGFISGSRAYLGGGVPQLSGFINENTTPLSGFSNDVDLDGLIHKDKTTLGGLLGIQRDESGEIIEIFSASPEEEHIAVYEAEAGGLQGHNAKSLVGTAWIVSKASTLASMVVFLRWNTRSIRKNTASAEKAPLPEKEIFTEAHVPYTAIVSSSPSPLEHIPASSPFEAPPLPLPSPPARVKTTSKSNMVDQAAVEEIMEEASVPSKGKQTRKCKGKSFLKPRSAPSTPRDSRQPQKPFTAPSMSPKSHGLNDQAADTDVKKRSIVRTATSPQHALPTSRFSRVSTAERTQKETARRIGQALAATWLILSLSGLIMGYISAILGVVCWWYLLPSLRKAVGDRPVVRSHHHATHDTNNSRSNAKSSNIQSKSNKVVKGTGSGKYELQSHEYKKKVIMDGLLDRGRRSNA